MQALSARDPRGSFASSSSPHPWARPYVPAYLRSFAWDLSPEDAECLIKKGAFAVPTESFRDELLQAYVDFVHVYMPALDIHHVVSCIDSNGATGQISLMLFHAIMFAGCWHVPIESLHREGLTRQAARKMFYQRTKLLYDFDYEYDQISSIHTLLILSFWYQSPVETKDNRYWFRLALSVGSEMGLTAGEEHWNLGTNEKRLWKRIWWSLMIRDTTLALGTHRPTIIKVSNKSVSMLDIGDFDLSDAPGSPGAPKCQSRACWHARGVDRQTQMAQLCIEMAKLSLLIGDVLSSQYVTSLRNAPSPISGETTRQVLLVPAKASVNRGIAACDADLDAWYGSLSDFAKVSITQASEQGNPLAVNIAFLQMAYCITVSTLVRPGFVRQQDPSDSNEPSLEQLRQKLRTAVQSVTNIAQELDHLGLVYLIPTVRISILIPAMVGHMTDVVSNDDSIRRAALENFAKSLTIMQHNRDVYEMVVSGFLDYAVKQAQHAILGDSGFYENNGYDSIKAILQYSNQPPPSTERSSRSPGSRQSTPTQVMQPKPRAPLQNTDTLMNITNLGDSPFDPGAFEVGAFAGLARLGGLDVSMDSMGPTRSYPATPSEDLFKDFIDMEKVSQL